MLASILVGKNVIPPEPLKYKLDWKTDLSGFKNIGIYFKYACIFQIKSVYRDFHPVDFSGGLES